MRFWREIVGDRWSGGVLCVLLMLTVVLQGALAARAAAATIAPDPARVICTVSAEASHRPAEPDSRHECPCAELCRAGLQMPVSLSPADVAGVPIRFADRIETWADHSAQIPFRTLVRQHHARGPPAASTRS